MDNTTNPQKPVNPPSPSLGGAKTPAGKAISKYNSLKHGVLKEVLSDYEKELSDVLIDDLTEELKPKGLVEQVLVERIAVWSVRLYRCGKAEGEFMKKVLGRLDNYAFMTSTYQPIVTDGSVSELGRTFARYDTLFENRIYKALHELERLQRMRAGEAIPAPIPVDVSVGSFGENTSVPKVEDK
jgi:hypothetical protein